MEKIEAIINKLDVAIDELGYGLRLDKYLQNRDFYIKNAIRFIQEAKEKIYKLEKANKRDDLTTAQRLMQHLDVNAKEYYKPIKKETESLLSEKD
jgi:hypothetical protein